MDPREYIGFQRVGKRKRVSQLGLSQEKHSKGSNFEAAGNNTESINAGNSNNLMEARGQGKPRGAEASFSY